MRIGIDVGGTFTDIVGIDDRSGRILLEKVPTTPGDLARGVLDGIARLLAAPDGGATAGVTPSEFVHGTTIGTNALIERKGARTGLVTTRGFRDVLEIGRVQRPAAGLYDFDVDNPPPLVPRRRRVEVDERVGSRGEVVRPLDEASARVAAETLRAQEVASVAVSFLFSFLHPAHERRVGEVLREVLGPRVHVSLSSEVAPEFREFERTSTVVMNAYLAPLVGDYLAGLQARLRAVYGEVDLRIMQASGGCMTPEAAGALAVRTVNSGPAGGALAGALVARKCGFDACVTVDMGGTSFDIGLVQHGEPRLATESQFGGYPVKLPVIDIEAIGAGGGSIAFVDAGGGLDVGPESAGAQPGPACYGRGGTRPTVTDANVVLGRIDPASFLGGAMALDAAAAERAVREHVGGPLGLGAEDAAWGVVRVINAKMCKGITARTIERGLDLRELPLVVFGGAGALHAVDLARELGMREVVVPMHAGNLSALGLLDARIRHDWARTLLGPLDEVDPAAVTAVLAELDAAGRARLAAERVPAERIEMRWSADLRFTGQSYELNVPLRAGAAVTREALADAGRAFERLHEQVYAFKAVDERCELVSLRVVALGLTAGVALARLPAAAAGAAPPAAHARRPVRFAEGVLEAGIWRRDDLAAGHQVAGPAVVEERLTSTVLPPGARARVDEWGALRIDPGAGSSTI
ncbi:MAG TPA: hydantoinase/oxoprolinase family protein [Myxococcota bacterium]|jgi:N-methylhydantoinase A|nr:hydantoinase/oxoprolinase family protein [Myxococcota bacterium]